MVDLRIDYLSVNNLTKILINQYIVYRFKKILNISVDLFHSLLQVMQLINKNL